VVKEDATILFLPFWLCGRRFGVRLGQVQCVVRAVDAEPIPQAPTAVRGVFDLRGAIVPLLNIRRRFGLPDREIGLNDHFIIATATRRTVALWVDDTGAVLERPAADRVPAAEILDRSGQIDGVLRLQDGLLLIHDLDRFLCAQEQEELQIALAAGVRSGN